VNPPTYLYKCPQHRRERLVATNHRPIGKKKPRAGIVAAKPNVSMGSLGPSVVTLQQQQQHPKAGKPPAAAGGGHHEQQSSNCGGGSSSSSFRMPLHYPRYKKADYEAMPEWRVDCLLREYGLPVAGDLREKREFAMGAFLWPDQY